LPAHSLPLGSGLAFGSFAICFPCLGDLVVVFLSSFGFSVTLGPPNRMLPLGFFVVFGTNRGFGVVFLVVVVFSVVGRGVVVDRVVGGARVVRGRGLRVVFGGGARVVRGIGLRVVFGGGARVV